MDLASLVSINKDKKSMGFPRRRSHMHAVYQM